VYLLLQGRLGIELEVALASWFSVELIPQFVVVGESPLLGPSTRPDNVVQSSDGLGPLSGASIGGAFWLQGKPFKGYGLRLFLTNYGMRYEATDSLGLVDEATYLERRLTMMFTSVSRFGPFTIATGIGLGYQFPNESRCVFLLSNPIATDSEGCGKNVQLALARNPTRADIFDVNSTEIAGSIDIAMRLSLGVSFD
jgi:hypothetical protein